MLERPGVDMPALLSCDSLLHSSLSISLSLPLSLSLTTLPHTQEYESMPDAGKLRFKECAHRDLCECRPVQQTQLKEG